MTIFTLTLDEKMVDVVGNSLAAQPYSIVAPVIAEIQKQVNEQLQAQQPKTNGAVIPAEAAVQ